MWGLPLLVVAVLLFAVSCGGGDDVAAPPPEPTRTVEPVPPAAEPEEAPSAEEPTEATAQTYGGGEASAGATGGCGNPAPVEQGTVIEATMESSGEERLYDLYVPTGYGGEPTPLVLGFHKWGTSNDYTASQTKFHELAEREGFLVAYVQAAGGIYDLFNTGAENTDVLYVSELLDELSGQFCLDEERVYATGIGVGAWFSGILACHLSDRITAYAAASSLSYPEGCPADRPIPVLEFHGTADSIVSPHSAGTLFGYSYGSLEEEAAAWAEANDCQSGRLEESVTATITQISYRDCQTDADVVVYLIDGTGFGWPNQVGHGIDGTAIAWDFFREHPLVR